MWHVLHLIARPIEVLLGLFCVLTAIVLYPNEEGKIQSKFEDFWIRVDDFKNLALSKHAAFMQQVARLESSLLDHIFGPRLVSEQSLGVSFCCSTEMLSIFYICVGYLNHLANLHEPFSLFDYDIYTVFFGLLIGALFVGAASIFGTKHKVVRRIIVLGTIVVLVVLVIECIPDDLESMSAITFIVVLGGFACDIAFIALTRRLLRWAGRMTSFIRVMATLVLNLLLALLFVVPLFVISILSAETSSVGSTLYFVALSNIFDVLLALLFVSLATILLIHRAVWPLLTRTLFRITDIGTKGRRAILTTVGLALLAAGISGKVPELVQKLIEKLGG